ncbi:DMT family transporter [Streptomyces sp. NPDC055078]
MSSQRANEPAERRAAASATTASDSGTTGSATTASDSGTTASTAGAHGAGGAGGAGGAAGALRGPLFQFLALTLAWGASFLLMSVALRALSPAQVAIGRMLLGAATLAGLMAVTRRPWPREPRILAHLAVAGLLMGIAPFLLYAWAGQYIPSGLSSIYNASVPITTMLIALAALPGERLTRTRSAALVAAALGIVVLAAPWTFTSGDSDGHYYLAQLACLGAAACLGSGFVYLRRFVARYDYDSITIAATQVGIGALESLPLIPFIALTPITPDPAAIAAVLALGTIGTGIAYIWNTNVVKAWGATAAAGVTYLMPVVGVALGILVLGETLRWNEPVGAVIVILGVLISHKRLTIPRTRRLRRTRPDVPPPHENPGR